MSMNQHPEIKGIEKWLMCHDLNMSMIGKCMKLLSKLLDPIFLLGWGAEESNKE